MKRLTIEHYKALDRADFYTVRFADKEICETDEFISRFINDLLYQEDLSKIVSWLEKMGNDGTLERFFRPERGAKAIPIYFSRLRLYCIRLSDELLVLGNGGIKSSKRIQDSPDAYPAFRDMVSLEKMLRYRIRHNEISIEGRVISGRLVFNIE